MKSPHSALEKTLDELAERLDAGWDAPDESPVSFAPQSTPLAQALDQLDADWDAGAPSKSPAPGAAQMRSAAARPSAVRPSQARPNPTRAVTPLVPLGATPLLASKRERRDAARKRRSHEAQKKSVHKKQRKAERRQQALRESEQTRAAEARALAERRAKESSSSKRELAAPAWAGGERAKGAQRVPERVRHDHSRSARPSAAEIVERSKRHPVVPVERGVKKLLLPFLIAILVAVTLGFALSRAH